MASRRGHKPRTGTSIGSALALERLAQLGFYSGSTRQRSAGGSSSDHLIRYDTYEGGDFRPYATVIVANGHIVPPLFLSLPDPEARSPYVAFTNGLEWLWFSNPSPAQGLVALEDVPPPPVPPPGGRALTPIHERRIFRPLLQAMNVALRDSRGGGIVERFDVISKVLFTKVFDEREVERGEKSRYELQIEPRDTVSTVCERTAHVWRRACRAYPDLYRGGLPELTQDQAALHKIVGIIQDVSLIDTPGDIKGVAYEDILRNTFEKNENQQFFTPHEIVEFIIKMVDPQPGQTICDPACGTGGFLVEAFRRVGDAARLVGADVEERLARVAQMNLVMHGARDAVVHYLSGMGSLAPFRRISSSLPPISCDVIVTNPPFGSDLSDETSLKEFSTGQGRPSRRRSVLFTERCLDLLKHGGRLAIVLDESVLNLPSNADVRELIRAHALVEAIVSLPDVAFMPYSTAKSSILFLRKRIDHESQGPIFMAEALEVGRRPNGDQAYSEERDSEGNRILLSDLPGIVEAYSAFKRSGEVHHPLCFVTPPDALNDRLDIAYYHPKRVTSEKELAGSRWPTLALHDCVTICGDSIVPATELGDSPVRWLGLGDITEGTGEYEIKILSADKIRSVAHVFRGGDILFSRLRPNLRKIVLIPDDDEGGICSAEMLVLRTQHALPQDHRSRPRRAQIPAVNPEYLAFLLRSDLVFGQLIYQVTGVGRPRVSSEAILSARIPVPSLQEQNRIVADLRRAQEQARAARREASNWTRRAVGIVSEAYDKALAELTGVEEREQ